MMGFFMFVVYILYSNSLQEYYCGQTSNLAQRLVRHNSGETKSIRHGVPWIVVGHMVFETRAEAIRKEKQIKKRGIGRWLSKNTDQLVQAG
jgi:putative endonuclease